MKTSFATVPLLAILPGCSLVRDLVGKALPASAPVETVVPSSLLEGAAARYQDSLRANLNWLETHGPKAYPASRIAFADDTLDPEHPVALELDIVDRTRRNSHRRSPEQLALDEGNSILELHPWKSEAIQAKWSGTLRMRVRFRSRDFLNSSSRYQDDTVTVRYADSSIWWKGNALHP